MYKYIGIFLRSAGNVSHQNRKEYLKSLYGDCYAQKFGMVDKFVKAVGYNDIYEDMVSGFPTIHEAKIPSPEGYKMPESLLKEGLHIDLGPCNVAKFVVPLGKEEHTDKKFSYSHKVLCKKFVEFLRKVYPELKIEMELLENVEIPLKDFALDYFYQSMDIGGIPYCAEFSSHRLLKDNELNEVDQVLREVFKFPFEISQHYCETCAKHHADHPYHIEIEYGV